MKTKGKVTNNNSKQLQQNAAVTKALMTRNASLLRQEILQRLLYPDRDINAACKYPLTITTQNYKDLYDREGIAARVVRIWPKETWRVLPEIYENEEAKDTEFEKAWKDIVKKRKVFDYLKRIDILSGIGRFGVLLLGINDGKELSEPVANIGVNGEAVGTNKYELLYLKAFDESVVDIAEKEKDTKNPRFGLPTKYNIKFEDVQGNVTSSKTMTVHWTRVIHIADNRESSDVFGVPRMQIAFNRLKDLQKILGGSGEMFWRGGFPGYSFEMTPEAAAGNAVMDTDTIKDQMELFQDGMQRYFATTGVAAKTLQPNVADPTGHFDVALKAIAISYDVPYRVFAGSEQAQLASVQDKQTWNERVAERQNSYVTSFIIQPFVDRLIAFGVLPEVEYFVDWPDLNTPTDKDKADVAVAKTEAVAKYVTGGCDTLIGPEDFLTMFLDLTEEEAKTVMANTEEHLVDVTDEKALEEEERISREQQSSDADLERQLELEKQKAKLK